jgi:hypothetical protein
MDKNHILALEQIAYHLIVSLGMMAENDQRKQGGNNMAYISENFNNIATSLHEEVNRLLGIKEGG